MQLKVDREMLVARATVAARLTKSTSTIPILSHLLLKAEGSVLSVSGTDLEAVVKFDIPAVVKKEGEVCIPARTFVDLLATLTADEVSMRLTPKTLTLKMECGSNTANVKGTDAAEYPLMGLKGELVTLLKGKDLNRVIAQASHAAAVDESRPMLQGVMMKFVDKTLELAAADGFRLAKVIQNLPYAVTTDQQVLTPSHGLVQLKSQKIDDDADVEIHINSGKTITFSSDDMRLDIRSLDLQFPDYEQIIPDSHVTSMTVNVKDFLKGMRAAQVFAREASNTARFRIAGVEDTVTILSRSDETGDNTSVVDADVTGDGLVIAINCRYVMASLNVVGTDKVVLEFGGPKKPIAMKPEGDDDVVFVIMPMQIGE